METTFHFLTKAASSLCVLILLPLVAQAGPLREPRQCAIFWKNIEKVTSWTPETKNNLYFQCLQRALDYKQAFKLTVQQSVELRDAWALTPPVERGHDEEEQ